MVHRHTRSWPTSTPHLPRLQTHQSTSDYETAHPLNLGVLFILVNWNTQIQVHGLECDQADSSPTHNTRPRRACRPRRRWEAHHEEFHARDPHGVGTCIDCATRTQPHSNNERQESNNFFEKSYSYGGVSSTCINLKGSRQ